MVNAQSVESGDNKPIHIHGEYRIRKIMNNIIKMMDNLKQQLRVHNN